MNTPWAWVKRIFPPLLLLPLFVMALDMGPHMFWLVGGFACLVSLVTLLKLLVRRIHSAFKPTIRPLDSPLVILRPLLTCLIFFSALLWSVQRETETRHAMTTFARNAASQVQEVCRQKGRCPDFLVAEGWSRQGRTSVALIGSMRAMFTPGEEGKTFAIHVRYRFDDSLFITGGVGHPLEEK